jgi:hypothetical protein
MSDKPFPALCKDCKHATPERNREWSNLCFHPKVVANDSWALANNREGQPCGVTCSEERKRRWFAPCGIRGKLWEVK